MEISPQQWDRVKELYEAALTCDPSQRDEVLRVNATNSAMLDEVRRLLAEHDSLGSFLSTTVLGHYVLPDRLPAQRFIPDQVLAARFRVVRFIAAGGMGEVYEAEDLTLEENLAIKTIRPGILQHANALERFKQEVHLARQVTHPNVCRVFDLFRHQATIDGQLETVFVTMELLQGETLADRIRRKGRFTTSEALPLIAQIAAGLHAAHRAGVVHGDLKPGNVILVPDNHTNDIRCVITDFGLAIHAEVDSTLDLESPVSRRFVGTPAYMAPEQIEGKEATRFTDIYALGLVIYEVTTGEHAFAADTPLGSAVKRLAGPVVSPRTYVPDLPDTWEQTIVRCLERNPAARFSSASDVAAELAGESVKPEGHLPIWKRPAVIVSVLFVLIAVLALGIYRLRTPRPARFQKFEITQLTSGGREEIAAISPDGRYVAFAEGEVDALDARKPAKQSLKVMQVGSGDQVQVLPPAEVDYQSLAFSRDGRFLYFMRTDARDGYNVGVLYKMTTLGGTAQPLISGVDSVVSLSPDGNRVAFARNFNDKNQPTLFVAKEDGSDEKPIAVRNGPEYFSVPHGPRMGREFQFFC